MRYPIPFVIYRNGKLNYVSSWVEAKYKYPLSDVTSIGSSGFEGINV
jgi:hypothetical protein